LATPNRNSSPTYRWATPFTRLRKENSFGKFVKTKEIRFLKEKLRMSKYDELFQDYVFELIKDEL
jgi:hypothetical protein